MNIKIGEIIENARREKGYTQGQLAKKLGVSNTAISKWEHGYNLPDISLLDPISKVLDIDVMLLLQLENSTKEDTSSKNKSKKIKSFINITLCILLFLSTITSVGLSVSNHYKKKIDKIKSEQLTAYRFQSVDSEFAVSGYMMFNNKENVVIFDNIEYKNKSKIINKEVFNYAELKFYIGEERIANRVYKSSDLKLKNINDILETFESSLKVNPKKINQFKTSNVNLTFVGPKAKVSYSVVIELYPII